MDETSSRIETWTHVFVEASFGTAEKENTLLVLEPVNGWTIRPVAYLSVVKGSVCPYGCMMLSERRQTGESTYCIVPLLCRPGKGSAVGTENG